MRNEKKWLKRIEAKGVSFSSTLPATSTEIVARVLSRSEQEAQKLLGQRFSVIERHVTRREEALIADSLRSQEGEAVVERRGVEIAAALDALRAELRALLAARSTELSTQLAARADELFRTLADRIAVGDLESREREQELLQAASERLKDAQALTAFKRRLDVIRTVRDDLVIDLIRGAATDLGRLREAYRVQGTGETQR